MVNVRSPFITFAKPKSVSFTAPLLAINIFSGFISLQHASSTRQTGAQAEALPEDDGFGVQVAQSKGQLGGVKLRGVLRQPAAANCGMKGALIHVHCSPDFIPHVRKEFSTANVLKQEVKPFGILMETLSAQSVKSMKQTLAPTQGTYRFTMKGCAIFRKIFTSLLMCATCFLRIICATLLLRLPTHADRHNPPQLSSLSSGHSTPLNFCAVQDELARRCQCLNQQR